MRPRRSRLRTIACSWILLGVLRALFHAPVYGIIGADSTYLLVDGQRTFIIGTYDPPPGVTRDQVRRTGFNLLLESNTEPSAPWPEGLWRSLRLPLAPHPDSSAENLIDAIENYESARALAIWHGPDEPAWASPSPVAPEWLEHGYQIVQAQDDVLPAARPVWINHACRGTRAHPDSFDLLQPYVDCADVFSMDIYPVPESFEHSILANKTITCVGEHVDILRGQVSGPGGGQRKPVWMVLQGFSWTDFNQPARWYRTYRSAYDFDRIRETVSGDLNGDGRADLILFLEDRGGSGSGWVDVVLSEGASFHAPETWADPAAAPLNPDLTRGLASGDFTGDGTDDVALWICPAANRCAVRMLRSLGDGFDSSSVWCDLEIPSLDPGDVLGFASGDFDGDGRSDLLFAAGMESESDQTLWVARAGEDSLESPRVWREVPPAEIDFRQVARLSTGDFTGDGRYDVCLLHVRPGDGLGVSVLPSDGQGFSASTCWWDSSLAASWLYELRGMTVQDLNGDGTDDLLLLHQWPDWLGALLSDGSRFETERWGPPALTDHPLEFCRACVGGDFDGNGLGDAATVTDLGFPMEDPEQRFDVWKSNGAGFGARGPSYEESRFMAYDAVIHGATGVIYWGLWYTGGRGAVWRAVSRVAEELHGMEGILVWDEAREDTQVSPSEVEFQLRVSHGDYCLLAANRSDAPVDAVFTGTLWETTEWVDVLFENRIVRPVSGRLSDRFEPYEVHVYLAGRSTPAPGQPGDVSIVPNPFGSVTRFAVHGSDTRAVEIDIYDVQGRLVRHLLGSDCEAGTPVLFWDGRDAEGQPVSSGIYFCRFRMGERAASRKAICVR